MIEANVKLDLYSYNIWLSSHESQGSSKKMEQAYELLTKDRDIVPNWTLKVGYDIGFVCFVVIGFLGKLESTIAELEKSKHILETVKEERGCKRFSHSLSVGNTQVASYKARGVSKNICMIWNLILKSSRYCCCINFFLLFQLDVFILGK
ncbi:putative pentatricopeptide [Lupinus albus]|uniref:Putative pentatricopeptide n=1 Tax=Lupinus albus TaxID=3870 RepID=A0A6A4NTZ7_LUPAL|nr:putative pentatricopeptide [Lupinus albus]